jgi:hypothetical protein
VTVTARPDGADLDVTGFQQQTILDLIALLAESPELMEDLDRIVTGPAAPPDPFHPEHHLPTEDLVRRLSAALPTSIRLHGPGVDNLAGALTAISRAQGSKPFGAGFEAETHTMLGQHRIYARWAGGAA